MFELFIGIVIGFVLFPVCIVLAFLMTPRKELIKWFLKNHQDLHNKFFK